MLNKIIEFSVKNKLIIGLFVIALIGIGTYQTTKLPIDAVPDITNNQVQVITIAPSFGATDIERLVTFPIEQANSNISGMKEIRSFSRFGLSLVTIVFDDDVDVYWARQQVSERLQQVQTQIPQGIGIPELGPVSTGLGEIYQYVVKPKKGFEQQFDATELRTIQDWIVRRQLLGVKGVAEVSSFGGKLKQYEIAINPNKLNAYGITIKDVFSALENNNQNTGGAYIEKGATVLYIRSEGLIGNIQDIENVAIQRENTETPLFIRDVAKIKIGYATRYGAMCYNDQGEVAGAIVMMLKGENSSQVIKNVKERIAQIQKTLPKGVEIEPFLDRTKMVDNAIGTVEKNLLEGALIVIFVLVLFLGNFRAGLLVASVIPLAMLFAICMMNLFGVSGNLMSLGALDFGLIVDGAVIIVEAVMHNLASKKKKEGLSQLEMDKEVTKSSSKMMNSAVFGQIIILIVYLPIFTLEGIEGKMFKPMAQTVAFALLGAFILSLTYIPMMSAYFLSKKTNHKKNLSDRLIDKVTSFYQKYLVMALRKQKAILITVIGLFIASIITLTFLGGEFIPALEEGDFAVDTRVLTGSNLKTSVEFTQKAAHILKTQFPEVEKVVTKIGSGEVPTDPMPMEAADMMVILKDKSEWTSAKTFDELAEKMSKALEDVPGITVGFQYPVQMRFNELMTGARQDVVCKIFGENLDTLAVYADKIGKIASKVEGAENLFVEPITGMPQVIIEYNRPMIAQYNLSISDINKIVNTAFAGQSTGLIFEEEKRFELVVRLDNQERKNLVDVQNLLIPLPNGNQIPLNQLANVSIKDGPNQIQREDAKRRIVVGFNVNGRDVQSIVSELQTKVSEKIKFPAGYYITYGGTFENLQKAKDRLMIAVPVSLLLIFVLLFFAFKSVKHSLLIYTAIPLSTIGGILFLALRGMPFSISAGVGFIALFGVAVLNGIVLIAEFNRLKSQGVVSLYRIVIIGTKLRLRPVLMTAFVASLGFLPMALSNGSGAEVQRPLATVVIGGLLVATFLTLFVLPILYILFETGVKLKTIPKKVIPIIILTFSMFQTANAQTKITLEKAIQTAVANNNLIKNEKLKAEYAKALIKSSTDIPKTNIIGEFGQVNSNYNDTKFGISQAFSLPTVYNRQKRVFTEEYNAKVLQANLTEFEIKKTVTSLFYNYLLLKEQEKLLQKADTLFSVFFEKAKLRLQKGESNILEKSTAETQKTAIAIQLKQLQTDIEILKLEFQLVLNSEEIVVPIETNLKAVLEENKIEENPRVKLFEQQKKIFSAETSALKSKRLPEIIMGYNNNSFKGIGLDDAKRFHSLQVGLGIPLFGGSQKAKINASKLAEKLAASNYQTQVLNLKNEYNKLMAQHKANLEIVNYFETSNSNNSKTITDVANKQFINGEINYLDYVILINQSIAVQNSYIEAVKTLNQTVISINYLNSNNQ
jgi:cobalt-zinc-cadmium resistance protein CzcA